MTPQEISDYKKRWMSKEETFFVRLHSDLDWQGKTWCRRNLERQQWKMNSWTDVYEHTFFFETEEHALQFEQQWPEFVNQ